MNPERDYSRNAFHLMLATDGNQTAHQSKGETAPCTLADGEKLFAITTQSGRVVVCLFE